MLEALFLIVVEHVDKDKWDTTRADIEKQVVLNPSTPESMLLRVVENPTHPMVLQYVMKNEGAGLTEAVIRKVAEDDGWGVSVVAKHPRLPLDFIEDYSKSKKYGVRMNIASHPSTPPEILRELANDDYLNIMGMYCVRKEVENNPNTPEDVVRGLSLWTEKSCKEKGYKNAYEEKQLRD
jgi:pentose-5-phosphate-3-epimerase